MDNGQSQKTSINRLFPIIAFARCRSASKGEMRETITEICELFNKLESSAVRRMFSFLLASEKSRSLCIPLRNSSPSKLMMGQFDVSNSAFNCLAKVVLPEPDSPVNQIVIDFGWLQ